MQEIEYQWIIPSWRVPGKFNLTCTFQTEQEVAKESQEGGPWTKLEISRRIRKVNTEEVYSGYQGDMNEEAPRLR